MQTIVLLPLTVHKQLRLANEMLSIDLQLNKRRLVCEIKTKELDAALHGKSGDLSASAAVRHGPSRRLVATSHAALRQSNGPSGDSTRSNH